MLAAQFQKPGIPNSESVGIIPKAGSNFAIRLKRRADLFSSIEAGEPRESEKHSYRDARARDAVARTEACARIVIVEKPEYERTRCSTIPDCRAQLPHRSVFKGSLPCPVT
jgi:hypothetical protein